MKILLTLNGSGSNPYWQTIEVPGDDADEISNEIMEALEAWTLAPGDTITIAEVS